MLNILGKYKNRKGFYQSRVRGMVLVVVLMVLDPQFRITVLHYTKFIGHIASLSTIFYQKWTIVNLILFLEHFDHILEHITVLLLDLSWKCEIYSPED